MVFRRAACAATALALLAAGGPAFAQASRSEGAARAAGSSSDGQGANTGPEQAAAPQTSDQPAAQSAQTPPSIQSSLGPYGDPGGIRSFLATRGITYSFTYIGETFGVVRGGQRRGG